MRRTGQPRRAIRTTARLRAAAAAAAFAAACAGLAGPAAAAQAAPAASDAWSYCRTAADKMERVRSMPPALLQAITLVETGRRGPDGSHTPWPWTVNAEGKGFYFASKREAVWAVRRLMADGVRSIDVGCMQINLRYHPRAFTSLEEAFDPMANMAYAASFLESLHARHGEWRAAAARYHSYNPALRERYAARVDKILARERRALAHAAVPDGAPITTASIPADAGAGTANVPETLASLGLRPSLIPGLRRSIAPEARQQAPAEGGTAHATPAGETRIARR